MQTPTSRLAAKLYHTAGYCLPGVASMAAYAALLAYGEHDREGELIGWAIFVWACAETARYQLKRLAPR